MEAKLRKINFIGEVMTVAAQFRDKNWGSWRNSLRCLHAWDIPLRDNGWEVEIKQKDHGASVPHSWKATADVSKEQTKVGEL